MRIIGCGLHARQQTVAMLDHHGRGGENDSEATSRKLSHNATANYCSQSSVTQFPTGIRRFVTSGPHTRSPRQKRVRDGPLSEDVR